MLQKLVLFFRLQLFRLRARPYPAGDNARALIGFEEEDMEGIIQIMENNTFCGGLSFCCDCISKAIVMIPIHTDE